MRIIRNCAYCGNCCRGSHRWGLLVVPSDLDRWRLEQRDDILRYVQYSDNRSFAAIIWRDMDTGHAHDRCPFLKRVATGRYRCIIYDTRPHICRQFACNWRLGKGMKTIGLKTFGWYASLRDTSHQVRQECSA